jgi:uridine kinase
MTEPVATVCGICGGSGAGKTTLTRHLLSQLGPQRVSVLAFDAYYRDLSHISPAERQHRNYDHPESLDHELFLQHLDQLRAGRDVDVPEYDFVTHTLTGGSTRVEARPAVIVEGILLFAFDEIVERLDLTVFLDIAVEIRLARRIHRDVTERGRDADDVRRQFAETVVPMHELFVDPNRGRADRIVELGEPFAAVAQELAGRLSAHALADRVS